MSTMVVAAAKAADIVCAHNKCVPYNTIPFAVFAACAGYTVDGGNGNKRKLTVTTDLFLPP